MIYTEDWAALENWNEAPIFYVEAPDGRKSVSEIDRQVAFFRIMHFAAPSVLCYAVPNAGKRNPMKARKEGIMGGVFDIACHWEGGEAYPEMKGYDKRGQAGKLLRSQIDWGNRMTRLGKHVGCFFDPVKAVQWLRSVGAPVAEFREEL